jgi:hypothetical protein
MSCKVLASVRLFPKLQEKNKTIDFNFDIISNSPSAQAGWQALKVTHFRDERTENIEDFVKETTGLLCPMLQRF